jgi:hypothetical protein
MRFIYGTSTLDDEDYLWTQIFKDENMIVRFNPLIGITTIRIGKLVHKIEQKHLLNQFFVDHPEIADDETCGHIIELIEKVWNDWAEEINKMAFKAIMHVSDDKNYKVSRRH